MIHGVLKTATPLTEKQLHQIERGFTGKLGNFVSFEIQEDPGLLGGFVAIIEGRVYDSSVKAQLTAMGKVIRGQSIDHGEQQHG